MARSLVQASCQLWVWHRERSWCRTAVGTGGSWFRRHRQQQLRLRTTQWLNLRRGPKLPHGRSCCPGRPTGRNVPVPRSESAEVKGPLPLQLWASGAPCEARRPRRAAPKRAGHRLPPILSAGQGRVASQACRGSSLFHV
eukprot:14448877-Alexandrium_andersonii.AAC.1